MVSQVSNAPLRYLLVEDWRSYIYAEPLLHRLRELGEEAHGFKESDFFGESSGPLRGRVERFWAKGQHRLHWGPRVARLNHALTKLVRDLRPRVVLLVRGDQVWPETLRDMKRSGCYVVGWNNDNPYSPGYPWYVWRHFRQGVPLYDRLYAYRRANVEDFRNNGCRRTGLLRSFYIRELCYPIDPRPSSSPYSCDVCFIGHWEHDGRDRCVELLLRASDINFRLWGTLWERSLISKVIRRRLGSVVPLYREQYNLALNSTKIALAFLSKLNADTYTRRCFEIPAAGAFMLAEYSDDLASLFAEGKEADYFRSPEEMMDKVRYYLRHETHRRRIASAGLSRVHLDGHEALDRARQIRDDVRRDLAEVRL